MTQIEHRQEITTYWAGREPVILWWYKTKSVVNPGVNQHETLHCKTSRLYHRLFRVVPNIHYLIQGYGKSIVMLQNQVEIIQKSCF